MKYLYELADRTDEEVYCPVGIYETLDEAIEEATSWEEEEDGEPPYGPDSWGPDASVRTLEIRQRPMGYGGIGKRVWTAHWTYCYDEKDIGAWVKEREEKQV